MIHFHRTTVSTADALAMAESFFPTIGLQPTSSGERSRSFSGPLGQLRIDVRVEGGHYTFVEAHTDQVGESRLDRNVKRYFVRLHKRADPKHLLKAAY